MHSLRLSLLALSVAALASAQTTFNATGTIQTYTVPPGVVQIQIDAAGAQGGEGHAVAGGKGARLVANFTVTPGETLNVVVGGSGGNGVNKGGGGGGSFVYRTATQAGLLIAAAGGGGSAGSSAGSDGDAMSAASDGVHNPGSAGSGGNGGAFGNAGGGGGLLTDGGGSGGQALANGAAGGTGAEGSNGGFGGGGGGAGRANQAGGGGGGYNGGGGGAVDLVNSPFDGGGGGGGSYSASSTITATSGFEFGDGYVTITVTEVIPPDSFRIGYAANMNIGDSVVNLTNSGTAGGFEPAGNICANVFVFAEDQQLVACCACPLTPNHLKTLSVRNDLISNTLTPGVPIGVSVAVVATTGTCNPSNPTVGTLTSGLMTFGTTIHAKPDGTYGVTEFPYSTASLSNSELQKLTSYCGFIQANGSGYGICKSCRQGAAGAERQ